MPPQDFKSVANEETRSAVGGPEQVVNSLLETRDHVASSNQHFEVSTDRREYTPTPVEVPLPPRYTFHSRLGGGGMGEVFRAYDNELRRDVAIKFMRPAAAASPFARRRFLFEAMILAQLSHPNVVDVFDKGEIDGRPYFVMAYLDGATLSERRHEYRTSAARAVGVVAEIAAAVQYAHDKGVYHRDLKPLNVVFDDGRPVVTDFGCACWEDGDISTLGYALLGTTTHMPPEVFEYGSKDRGAEADLWALGVMLFQLLAGELPFADARTPEGRKKLLSEDPAPIRSHSSAVPGVDDRLEAIASKALAKRPEDRYQTVAEFVAELEAWLQSYVEPPPLAAKPKLKWRWVVAGVALFSVLVVSVATLWPKMEDHPSISERIAADQEVPLIGVKGMPVYPAKRAAGFTEGTLEINSEGLCEASAARVAMFDFSDVPLPLPVRFTAQVSHTIENVGSKVGIYAGRKAHIQANGKDVCHAAAVNWITASPFPPLNADKSGTASFALYWVAPADLTNEFITPCTHPSPTAIQRPTPPAPGDELQFRTLTIDLYPTTVAATNDGAAVVNPINLPRSLAVMRTMIGGRKEAYGDPVFSGNGFGLIVIQGSAVVRNATLRRIPQ